MLIGILGEAGSGKDTAGQILVQDHGYYSLAFADPIKLFCMWMFGWEPHQLWGDSSFRNEPDSDLPFYRCPSCSFHWPDTAMAVVEADTEHVEQFICPICYSRRAPSDWRANLSPRFALQDLGTEWARYFNKRCHVDFAIKRAAYTDLGVMKDPLWHALPREVRDERWTGVTTMNTVAKGTYISDCRFRNEVQLIREAGGKVYRIVRQTKEDNTTTGIAGHASEMEQREIANEELDGIIENHGTLDALRGRLRALIESQS
jgi:hypothetical protein